MLQPKWPRYEVAQDDSVFALGVVSINYARFERTHVWMLAAVANMSEDQASVIVGRTNASEHINLVETFLKRRTWPNGVSEAIGHYIKAARVLIDSRNALIHSNLVRSTENRTAVYSLSRQGRSSMFHATLDEIRRVADDLEAYFTFGLMLANYIATEIHAMAREAGIMAISQIPPLPPMPAHINPEQRR